MRNCRMPLYCLRNPKTVLLKGKDLCLHPFIFLKEMQCAQHGSIPGKLPYLCQVVYHLFLGNLGTIPSFPKYLATFFISAGTEE